VRLFVCILGSIIAHLILFSLPPFQVGVPSLTISVEPKMLDLQIRTQAKHPEISSALTEKKQKPISKKVSAEKKLTKKGNLKKEEVVKELSESTAQSQNEEYVSDRKKPSRMVERAEYLSNPPPKYPEQARRRMQEGMVTLVVDIDSKGFVTEIQIKESSGFSLLDGAAEETVAKWRFSPATIGEKQVSSRVIVPIFFKLNK
jgi:protein TonB